MRRVRTAFLVLAFVAPLCGCVGGRSSQTVVAPAARPAASQPAGSSQVASQPAAAASQPAKPNRDPARFAAEIEAFEKYDRKNTPPPNPVLFVGSSSIVRWPSARDYPNLTVLNRGFGGSTPADVNFYFDRIVAPYRPRLIVLFTSDNGIVLGDSAEKTAADFREFVARARQLSPTPPILFLAIKPSPSRMDFWPIAAAANRLIEAECRTRGPQVRYVDVATPMLDAAGQPRPELFVADRLHLSDAGYALWNAALAPVLAELLR